MTDVSPRRATDTMSAGGMPVVIRYAECEPHVVLPSSSTLFRVSNLQTSTTVAPTLSVVLTSCAVPVLAGPDELAAVAIASKDSPSIDMSGEYGTQQITQYGDRAVNHKRVTARRKVLSQFKPATRVQRNLQGSSGLEE